MKELPSNFAVSIHPREYLKQGSSHCGAYTVKGIMSAYGLDQTDHPKEYHEHLLGKITGLTFGRSYWPRILSKHGVKAIPQSASDLSEEERIQLLKKLLSENNPVMVSIGNGYLLNGAYNSVMGRIIGHWISMWGYDDEKNLFYVYDSAIPIERHNRDIPVGNTKRTYEDMLRDWRGGLLSMVRGLEGYHYIKVSNEE